ncbi:betaine-aldehyde dehydrogenase [Phycicoccus sp. Soil802]|nr:betaine-aldehyde dehydrogenase [Phycicoccus sp. Soil802]
MTDLAVTPVHPFIKGPMGLWIDGRSVEAQAEKVFDTLDPASGLVLGQLAQGETADVDRAVRAARVAFEGTWSRWTPYDRQTLLMRVHELVDQRFEEMATLETLDLGAPITRTLGLKSTVLQIIAYYAGQTTNVAGETLPNSLPGAVMTMTLKAPLGVVGAVLAWNNPLIGEWWTVCGVIASGCTAVLKPGEVASLSVLYMVELLRDAGLPDGVVNVVTGFGPTAGAALAAHPDVDRIMFTGSAATGRRIVAASASNMKRVQVELGGKSPDVVFADADLDRAVPSAAMSVFSNSGQLCVAGSRLLVQRSIHDEVVDRLSTFASGLRVGNGMDPEVDLGPVVSQQQLDRVMGYVNGAVPQGATVAAGGRRLLGDLARGFFVEPTVVSAVTSDMTIAREEVFGPVIAVLPFDDEDEALRLANDTEYGLAGGVWTTKLSTAMRMVHGIRAGTVWVNNYGLMDPAVGMSGAKLSGYGTKGSPAHIDAFLYEKCVYIDLE